MPLRKLTVTIEELPDENASRPTPGLEPGGAEERLRSEQEKRETDAVPDPPPRKPPA